MNRYYINFLEGTCLGHIIGGQFNGELIYISENNIDDNSNLNKNFEKFLIDNKKYDLLDKIDMIPDEYKKKILSSNILLHKTKFLQINDGQVEPVIDPNKERQIFYIAGKSGSGKSHYANYLIKSYNMFFPKNNVFLFSNKEYDPVLDQHKLIRVKIDDELIQNPIMCSDIPNCLVIFDDVEAISNKKLAIEMENLRDRILNQGRSYKIYFILICHLINDYKKTRTILNEMDSMTIFPGNTTEHSLKYLFDKYFGFDKKTKDLIKKLPSRWVTIYRNPLNILYEHGSIIPD